MESLVPMRPDPIEIAITAVAIVAPILVLVVSYRRHRCLFDRTALESLAVALISATFWPLWLIGSIANRRVISASWASRCDRRTRAGAGSSGG